jgi:hypothetical protein
MRLFMRFGVSTSNATNLAMFRPFPRLIAPPGVSGCLRTQGDPARGSGRNESVLYPQYIKITGGFPPCNTVWQTSVNGKGRGYHAAPLLLPSNQYVLLICACQIGRVADKAALFRQHKNPVLTAALLHQQASPDLALFAQVCAVFDELSIGQHIRDKIFIVDGAPQK